MSASTSPNIISTWRSGVPKTTTAYGTRHEEARLRGLRPGQLHRPPAKARPASAPPQPAAAGRGLPAVPAGPQPPLGPGLADPGAGLRLGRRPALSLAPRRLKAPLPVPQSRAPEAASACGPTDPARRDPDVRIRIRSRARPVVPTKAGVGLGVSPYPDPTLSDRNTLLIHLGNTLVKGDDNERSRKKARQPPHMGWLS